MGKTLLQVENLRTYFHTFRGVVKAVDGISFSLDEGQVLGIVGESGSGKSVTSFSILKLVESPGVVESDHIYFRGEDISGKTEKEMMKIRGKEISMIFQDPMTSLNPLYTIEKQITEMLDLHQKGMSKKQKRDRCIELLHMVGIPNPERRAQEYPHQFSGGMRQRAMIATALACGPKLLIADEPTTALDVTIQAQIIDLMKQMQKEMNAAILLITHDLGVVADIARRICVMYSGKIVERGSADDIFYRPRHPYTMALLSAVPRLDLENKEHLASIEGTPPDLLKPPAGCPFCTRCKYCMPICQEEMPESTDFGGGHEASCWLHDPRAPRVDAPLYDEKEGRA